VPCVESSGDYCAVQGVFGGTLGPTASFIITTSGVTVPDGTGTQYMSPREFPLFQVSQRFPQYYGFRSILSGSRNHVTVSEILCPASVIHVTYPGVVVPREYSTASGVLLHPMFILASCHAPVSLSAVKGVFGGYCAVQGVFGGLLSRAGSLRGDPQPLGFFSNSITMCNMLNHVTGLFCA
jgi:hypothetical protein